MRRENIVLGVEYCETAPLAYGNEPFVPNPKRVRFVSKEPHVILTKCVVITKESGSQDYKTLGHVIIPRNSGAYRARASTITKTPWAAVRKRAPGDEFWSESGERGSLPAEEYKDGEWVPTLVVPAAVHRTWEEYVQERHQADERRKQRQVECAPRAAASAARDLVDTTRLLHPTATRAEIRRIIGEKIEDNLDRLFPEEDSK